MSANEFYSSGNQGQYQGGNEQQQQPQEGESGERGLLAVCTIEIELVWGIFLLTNLDCRWRTFRWIFRRQSWWSSFNFGKDCWCHWWCHCR